MFRIFQVVAIILTFVFGILAIVFIAAGSQFFSAKHFSDRQNYKEIQCEAVASTGLFITTLKLRLIGEDSDFAVEEGQAVGFGYCDANLAIIRQNGVFNNVKGGDAVTVLCSPKYPDKAEGQTVFICVSFESGGKTFLDAETGIKNMVKLAESRQNRAVMFICIFSAAFVGCLVLSIVFARQAKKH